jgi:PAS domain S-box-containing protein
MPFEAGAEGAATLDTVVETVRRILRADTASIASFSEPEQTITWLAMSGFRSAEAGVGIVNPLRGEFAERAAAFDQEQDEPIIEVRGLAGDLPVSEFPLHSAEGVRYLALARLRARGQSLGVLAIGYREYRRLSAEERQQLEGLAEMAALALDNARLLDTLGAAKRVWEQTFDAIPDGIIVHDDRMSVVRCNLAAAEAMGLHPAQVAGMSCAEAFSRLFGERAAAYHMRPGTPRTTSSFELQAEDGRRYLVAVAPSRGRAPVTGCWVPGQKDGRRMTPTPDTRHPTPSPRGASSPGATSRRWRRCRSSSRARAASPPSASSPRAWRTRSTTRSPPSPPAPRRRCATSVKTPGRRAWAESASGTTTSKR